MNEEERQSQVSALFDGELDDAQTGLVVRRVLKDQTLRATWSRYALVGASLRGEPLSAGVPGRRRDVAARVAAALSSEAELVPSSQSLPPARRATSGVAMKAAFGGALAAGVAAASLLVMRMQAVPDGAPVAQMAAATPVVTAPVVQPAVVPEHTVVHVAEATAPAPSYTTPEAGTGNGGLPAPLVNYVVAHSEYLTPVMRFNPLSAVMMGTFEPGELVEATEAEIGAVRH
jgi:negative regulator of sigma E activity